jgi:hypothetical protein
MVPTGPLCFHALLFLPKLKKCNTLVDGVPHENEVRVPTREGLNVFCLDVRP